MDSVYLYDRWYGHIPSAGWDEVTSQTEWVCDHWDQPDEGIWETRGGPGEVIGYMREHEITLTWNPAAAALQARAPELPRPSP
jgi:GH15 family glucan-1,4-alpha-glucosidase